MQVSGRGRGRVPGSRDNAHLGAWPRVRVDRRIEPARGARCQPASSELQAAERRLGAGACAPELAAKRPPGPRDPLRRHRVTRDRGGGAAAFVAIGYGRAAAAGFQIHTAEQKCNIVVALGTSTGSPGEIRSGFAFPCEQHCCAPLPMGRTNAAAEIHSPSTGSMSRSDAAFGVRGRNPSLGERSCARRPAPSQVIGAPWCSVSAAIRRAPLPVRPGAASRWRRSRAVLG